MIAALPRPFREQMTRKIEFQFNLNLLVFLEWSKWLEWLPLFVAMSIIWSNLPLPAKTYCLTRTEPIVSSLPISGKIQDDRITSLLALLFSQSDRHINIPCVGVAITIPAIPSNVSVC